MSSEFREAIYRQPENLRAGARAFADARAGVEIDALCAGTIVLTGIGASAHALIPTMRELRAAGRRAFAVPAAELGEDGAARLGDVFVMVSHSGASTEIVDALEHLAGAPVVAISANGDSPLAAAADLWLPLGPLPDTPVATLSYTATLQALGMLCDAVLGTPGRDAAWDRVAGLAGGVIERTDPVVKELAERFASVRALDAVGGGPAHASAGETALLGREALRLASTGMETREYLHGPLEAVREDFGCVVFGRDREQGLATELGSFGATVALISDTAPTDTDGVTVIGVPEVTRLAAPILQILPVQLLVEHTARLRGLTIGPLTRHQQDTKVA
jgi:glucosamine--fructose-6-phosphate aminotransferase (isomerizing)